MTFRIAVDIGGTFTDLVGVDSVGATFRTKVLSRPDDLAAGVLAAIDKADVPPPEVELFVHGSTVAINAFLESTGAKTALVTTKGFRDVYEMGRKTRPDMYNLFFQPRACLVPRSARYEIDERIGAHGAIIKKLDDDEVRRLAGELPADVEAVAICLLNSYAEPAHEARVAELVREARPDAYVSASTDVSRELREYERTSTAVMNAYVGPRTTSYLAELQQRLGERGFSGTTLLTQSNGGMITLATARRQPVRLIESGPAAGVIAAAHLCEELRIENAIAFDMGGTTAKACVIEDGVPEMASEYYVGGRMTGLPIQVPCLEIVEVGAGGGSIVSVDEAGGLRVGPRSAGAAPGPACYGLGGVEPTVTDANLLVGRIGAGAFLGGEMQLDYGRAEAAMTDVAERAGAGDVLAAANGVIRLANTIMGHAIRAVTIERGRDPRDYALVCYGGGGPVHAVDVAAELEIPTIVIPATASTFAAFGMLVADVRHDVSASFVRRLPDVGEGESEAIFEALAADAGALLSEHVTIGSAPTFRYRADLRYVGQFHTLTLPLATPSLLTAGVEDLFHRLHDRRYGHSAVVEEIEVTALRVSAIVPVAKPEPPDRPRGATGRPSAERDVVLANGDRVPCPVWRRQDIPVGVTLAGPAIIEEATTAVALRAGDSATATEGGDLVISVGSA